MHHILLVNFGESVIPDGYILSGACVSGEIDIDGRGVFYFCYFFKLVGVLFTHDDRSCQLLSTGITVLHDREKFGISREV